MGKKGRKQRTSTANAKINGLPEYIDGCFCINVKERKDRLKKAKKHFTKRKVPVEYVVVKRNTADPARGCLTSHLKLIKMAKERGWNNVLVLEDDCVLSTTVKQGLPSVLPPSYGILFLGGNIQGIHPHELDYPPPENDTKNIGTASNPNWVRLSGCLTTHAYVMSSVIFDHVIDTLEQYEKQVDVFFSDEIVAKGVPNGDLPPSYVLNPPIATQRDDYSDIEKKVVNYKNLIGSQRFTCYRTMGVKNRKPTEDEIKELELDEDELVSALDTEPLNDDELPTISLITPTFGRRAFFPLPIYQFLNMNYPAGKMQWVIVDDGYDKLEEIIPRDPRIKYVRVEEKEKMPVSEKRNIGVKYSDGEIIIALDDDDIYMPNYCRALVTAIVRNKHLGVECAGVSQLYCYDLKNQTSFVSVGHTRGEIAEGSMAFTRAFWEEREFDERVAHGEGIMFLRGRDHRAISLPSIHIMIAITHGRNTTLDLREQANRSINRYDLWDDIPVEKQRMLLDAYNKTR